MNNSNEVMHKALTNIYECVGFDMNKPYSADDLIAIIALLRKEAFDALEEVNLYENPQ